MQKHYSTQFKRLPGSQRTEPETKLPSLTVKGESHSISEILARAMQGIAPTGPAPQWFDQEDLEKIDRFYSPMLDLTDLDELKARNQEMTRMIEKEEQARTESNAKAAAAAAAEIAEQKEAVAELVKSKKYPPKPAE